MGRDYYNTLGITKSASAADVQKAYVPKKQTIIAQLFYSSNSYRRLALKYHPEKNEDPGAGEKSRDIAEAYDVLNDRMCEVVYSYMYVV